MSSDPPPPWFATNDDGDIHLSGIPDRLLRHPELRARNLIPFNPMKPGVVYHTDPSVGPARVIKILNLDTAELFIYQELLQDLECPANHVLPCDISQAGHPLLIMPRLRGAPSIYRRRWSWRDAMDVIFQFVEGIEYLHDRHIAHLDLCEGNVLGSNPSHARLYPELPVNRLYIIDFGSARRFPLGPGAQVAITLPPTQFDPPNGLTHFDPYSWDIHCMGRALQAILQSHYWKGAPPWLARRYVQWLVGDERGCTGVCHCRPTARNARRALIPLRWFATFVDSFKSVAQSVTRLFVYQTRT